jgi:hypothetical protein
MIRFDNYQSEISKPVWQSGLVLRYQAENCFKGVKFSQILKKRGRAKVLFLTLS